MSSKNNMKQHYIAIFLFLVLTCFFCTNFFTSSIEKKILSTKRQMTNEAQRKNFIQGQAPRESYDLKALELQDKKISAEIALFEKSLNQGEQIGENQLTGAQKALKVMRNAQLQNLQIINSSIEEDKSNQSTYKIEFRSSFSDLILFIRNSYLSPGDISIKKVTIEAQGNSLFTKLEVLL